ncbi:efflux transporter periplasmic adaptor subunit [Echinicola strongylocentroti]|uniref:Efflux transporter periplasmic adaptor subunit n=1 Tax=Echinicola strongylocentroti TaxID=1795355 RepID=A0A2Z4IMI4_9BACT|nr:efflux RND transporter periplasmic adaptor subunit [Echinicola strongylocentroti]AWW32331.1 efflux transporter periplasmic adaptor subunit [Echinicola strongylocentroti]
MAKKKSNKLIYILGGIVGVLILLIIIGRAAGWVGGAAEVEAEVTKAAKKTIVEKVSASGVIEPETEVKLSPDVAGEIIELNINEGDSVKQNDLLVKIRPDNFMSALDRTRANLNQQKANLAQSQAALKRSEAQFEWSKLQYERNKSLYESKVISDSEFEQATADYVSAENDLEAAQQSVEAAEYVVKSSQASVEEANENLRLTNVFAPTDGVVSKLLVEKGERVVGTQQMAGTEMLRIADLSVMEVVVDVNENDIVRISLGDTTIIEVDAYSHIGEKFTGVVTSIANSANEKATQDAVTEFEVEIRILNESYEKLITKENRYPFRPGMTASVEIITEKKEDVLSVPLAAVTTRDQIRVDSTNAESDLQEIIYMTNGNKVKMTRVKTGISDFENIEVLEGIQEGEELVSGPYFVVSKQLKDGDLIKKNN